MFHPRYDRCDCDCHTNDGVMHCVPCCYPCAVCGENVTNLLIHERDCFKAHVQSYVEGLAAHIRKELEPLVMASKGPSEGAVNRALFGTNGIFTQMGIVGKLEGWDGETAHISLDLEHSEPKPGIIVTVEPTK